MNRIVIMERLLASGMETKEAVVLCKEQMRDKAQFFAKLHRAQQALGMIIKNTRDQRGRNYAGVDQFVGKAQRAFNEAGLTMFEHETGVVARTIETARHSTNKKRDEEELLKETTAHRSWMIDAIIGDTETGFSMPVHYEVPINPSAFSKEPEKAVGAADSYGLKYMTRSILFAERSEDDPDRRDDPDHRGYDNDKPKKKSTPSVASTKKKTPKKVSATQRKKQAQVRLSTSRRHLGNKVYNEVVEQNSMNNLEEMEGVADVLEARTRLDGLIVKTVTQFGQPQVDGWLEIFRPFTKQENIDDAISALVDELNSEGKKK